MASHETGHPVFYDPHQRRGRWVTRTAQVLALIASGLFTAVVGAVLINPALPALGLPSLRSLPQRHHLAPPQPEKPGGYLEHRFRRSKRALQNAAGHAEAARAKPPAGTSASTSTGSGSHAKVPLSSTSATAPAPAPLHAFFVNWDDASETSLREHVADIDVLVPEWLHLVDGAGAMRVDDEARQARVLAMVRERRPGLAITPLINNFDGATMTWQTAPLATMLASPAARRRLIDSLRDYVQGHRFAGVNIDFENVPGASQRHLLQFMTELHGTFQPLGLRVSQSVPLDDPAFDYRALARVTDALLLMAYDEHASESDAGPIASQAWFADLVRRRAAEIGAGRYIVALGNYGYDWRDRTTNGDELSFQDALRVARESEGKIALSPDALNPTFDYYDDSNVLRHVWFLDAITAFNQLHALRAATPADTPWQGIALWRLGSEDPAIWPLFARRADLGPATAQALSSLHYGYDVDYEGQGEVLKVTATPADGERRVTVDELSGLIKAEQFTAFPSPYVIERRGRDPRKLVALTFDDGPDPVYTPAILDILAAKQAPATFFIIGLNADLHPALLERIVAAGHEIGNHTFTHPDVSQVSPRQFRLEVNATERLFEARLGRRSLLFRPPYAEDIEPENPDQVAPLLFTSERGYYTIGMGIDPNDWQTPGVDAIVERIVTGAESGLGQIALLHDSGGDRTQTVAALPLVIDALRQRGFTLVPVSTLLGVSRDALMPPVPQATRWLLTGADAAFLVSGAGSAVLRLLFLLGIGLGVIRLLLICVLAVWQKLRPHRAAAAVAGGQPPAAPPPYAVLVPAFNEERVIVRTVASIRNSEPPPREIIVIDDGSSDRTAAVVREAFAGDETIKVFTKGNAGKAHALNYGLARTDAPVVVALDADTIFQPDTTRRLVAHLADPRIGAVAGNAKVGNRINLLTRWQALEYITSQNLDRRAFDRLNCVTVVPGAVGAWRRDLVLAAGGFPADTLAEDADLTLAMLRQGTHVVYEERAIAWTEAPDTVRGLLKQRFRWVFGTLQAAWKQRGALLRPRYGALGLVALPNLLVFGVLFPLVSPLMDLQMLLSLAAAGWESRFHPAEFTGDVLARTFFYYALFVAVDLLAAALAFTLERHERWSLLVWLPLQRLAYRQLMYLVVIRAVMAAARGHLVGWGKLERKATVT